MSRDTAIFRAAAKAWYSLSLKGAQWAKGVLFSLTAIFFQTVFISNPFYKGIKSGDPFL
jgi:hypothetical protein